MALVDYSDSESESDSPCDAEAEFNNVVQPLTSRRSVSKLPTLPQSFHSLYASNVRTGTQDDPSLHAGRVRQVPHVEGNWPTHIFLECKLLNRMSSSRSPGFAPLGFPSASLRTMADRSDLRVSFHRRTSSLARSNRPIQRTRRETIFFQLYYCPYPTHVFSRRATASSHLPLSAFDLADRFEEIFPPNAQGKHPFSEATWHPDFTERTTGMGLKHRRDSIVPCLEGDRN